MFTIESDKELPVLSNSLFYEDGRFTFYLLYDPLQVKFAYTSPTIFSDIVTRRNLKETFFAAVHQVIHYVFIYRFRRKLQRRGKNTVTILNVENNLHATSDSILTYVEILCNHYENIFLSRYKYVPDYQALLYACIYHHCADFLSIDGTLLILEASTLQLFMEISRYLERKTKSRLHYIIFPKELRPCQQQHRINLLSRLHVQLDFVDTPFESVHGTCNICNDLND
jgi:hypothetical protein